MADEQSAGFLARHGAALIDAGYTIVPIKPGSKATGTDEWEKLRLTKLELGKLVANGYAKHGVGILTKYTPGVDLDIRDEELSMQMEIWCRENIGDAPVRIGMPPKRLLLYRSTEPFRKITSKKWIDDIGCDHKVEILGDGQQFVAYHIHPDTHKPYVWLYKEGPLTIDASDLPTLSEVQGRAIVAEFEAQAEAKGWKPKKSGLERSQGLSKVDQNDPFAADVHKAEISDADLHAKLMLCPGAEDYETWLQIGMALFHQHDGEERGRELWHEWSESAHNYDADALDRKWDTFDISDKKRAPVTARLIIKLAKAEEKKLAVEVVEDIRSRLLVCDTLLAVQEVCKDAKRAEFDAATREMIVGVLKSVFKKVTGQNLGIKIARDMVRYESPNAAELPRWLKDWIYLSLEDKFFNSRTMDIMSREAFNSVHARQLLTKQDIAEGRSAPEELPSNIALNRYQIQVVRAPMYLPGQEPIFTMNGVPYVNLFTERNQPAVPDKLTAVDRANVQVVEDHFAHLITNEKEREIFKDWLCYVVQTSSRPNWSIFLQGQEGDGKSFFAVLLAAILGAENVRLIKAKTLEGDFNGWAEGDLLKFVEEVKMQGHNRYDVLNSIKDNITNPVVEIHRKGVDPYNRPNTAGYCLFSNFRDALPLFANDTRFFVLFSRFQTLAGITAFKDANPNYYELLYSAVEESAGAIRGWFLKRPIGVSFNPSGRAPQSISKRYMVQMNKSEEMQALDELLATCPDWDVSTILLNSTKLADLMVGMDVEVPQTRAFKKMLSDIGYTFLGRVRIKGQYCRFWSQEPDRFLEDGIVNESRIREWSESDL